MTEGWSAVPSTRVRVVREGPPRPEGTYVLYWMTASRRLHHSFGLQRAVEWATHLRRPLLVFEALRVGHRWAADRHHVFVLQGMQDHAERLRAVGVRYLPYVERRPGAGRGLLEALSQRASVVVTDDSPAYFLPRMISAAGEQLRCRLEAIDGNGLLPVRQTDRLFTRAHSFRAYLQRHLPPHLEQPPWPEPLRRYGRGHATVARTVLRRWPMATMAELARPEQLVAALPIDHGPGAIADVRGGARAGKRRLERFIRGGLSRYADERSHPDADAGSGLSPYLHYGHVGVHQVLHALARADGWCPGDVGPPRGGAKEGFWGMSPPAEAFMDELVTWRELGLNRCTHQPDYDRFQTLPRWALDTMAKHAADPRPVRYDFQTLESGQTHDPIWNAAQRQLRREGRVHGYLRMLWGKKIYEWSSGGPQALEWMIELNNRWSLDGRDPNSYSGIAWVLGRFDRAWGPERPIFGTLRYMSSDSARRKLRLRAYLHRYGP